MHIHTGNYSTGTFTAGGVSLPNPGLVTDTFLGRVLTVSFLMG